MFIVIYGAPNLGKTTQAQLVKQALEQQGQKVVSLKYPLYDLEPTGPLINSILRNPEELDREYSAKELQQLNVQNRMDYQPRLEKQLTEGKTVLAEAYKGTGIIHGVFEGIPLTEMEEMNKGLIEPDIAILLDGKQRYIEAGEKNHRYEGRSQEDWENYRQLHLDMATRYDWKIVNANQSQAEVSKDILKVIETSLRNA